MLKVPKKPENSHTCQRLFEPPPSISLKAGIICPFSRLGKSTFLRQNALIAILAQVRGVGVTGATIMHTSKQPSTRLSAHLCSYMHAHVHTLGTTTTYTCTPACVTYCTLDEIIPHMCMRVQADTGHTCSEHAYAHDMAYTPHSRFNTPVRTHAFCAHIM